MSVLVTGGAGYIGSHTVAELLQSGQDVVIFDNFSNSSKATIKKIESITGSKIKTYEGDIRDTKALDKVFNEHAISCVIHFAGLKAVGESFVWSLEYYDNNVHGTLTLCKTMKKHNCKSIIFSSSATVYGDPLTVPIREDAPLSATSPYGRSKLIIEEIFRDLYASDNEWKIILLRYFNPVGAHSSGLIGENPNGIPNNLMPFIAQVATSKREFLSVFGDDYDTCDGTGVRDYIHVVDLAKGHLSAIDKIQDVNDVLAINLGTGGGCSVLEMISTFERVTNQAVPYRIVERRRGDVASCYADVSYAKEVLGWEAELDTNKMCEDAWRWQVNLDK